jgi:hypothetical protein
VHGMISYVETLIDETFASMGWLGERVTNRARYAGWDPSRGQPGRKVIMGIRPCKPPPLGRAPKGLKGVTYRGFHIEMSFVWPHNQLQSCLVDVCLCLHDRHAEFIIFDT